MITRLPGERVNFWTHFAGFVAWIPFTLLLVMVSAGMVHLNGWFLPTGWDLSLTRAHWDLVLVALIYGGGVMFLFFCSATYHRFKQQENEKSLWRTMDHFAIFVMIAASYTPVVWIWLDAGLRFPILAFQWTVTLVGLLFKIFLPQAPRWIDPILYLLMGWVAVVVLVPLYQAMPFAVFFDMVLGGVWFTLGAVIYATKWPNPKPGIFGFHELFHVFILGGAATHASMVLRSLMHAWG